MLENYSLFERLVCTYVSQVDYYYVIKINLSSIRSTSFDISYTITRTLIWVVDENISSSNES